MGIAQHHDAVSGTEKQHVADDYAQRLSDGIDSAIVINHLLSIQRLSRFFYYISLLSTKHIKNYYPKTVQQQIFQLNFYVNLQI